MSGILIDGHNGLLRIECIAAGPNNEPRPSGTLLISGNVAGSILQSLTQDLAGTRQEDAGGGATRGTA